MPWDIAGDASAGDSTVDFSTDTGKIRLLISDTDASDYVFTDAEIQAFLDLGGEIYLAAALASEAWARDRARVEKRRRDGGMETEQVAIADLLALAKQLRKDSPSGGLQTATIAASDAQERLSEFWPNWRSLDDLVVE